MGTNTIMSKSETKYQRLPVDDHEAEYKPTFNKKLPIVGGFVLLIVLAVLVLIFVIQKSSENNGKYMPQYFQ